MKRAHAALLPALWIALMAGSVSPVKGEELTSAKALAMGGAVVAQADEALALRWNPAALAAATDRRISVGLEFGVQPRADFFGFDPNPGFGSRSERPTATTPSISLDWIEPLTGRWTIGAALRRRTLFGQDWSGAAPSVVDVVARESRLDGYRVDFATAVALHPKLFFGAGIHLDVVRLDWERVERLFYPTSSQFEEVGYSHLQSRTESAAGITAGMLADGLGRWSLGLRWTRAGRLRLSGDGQFRQLVTGDAALDLFASTQLPFGQPAIWQSRFQPAESWVGGAAYQIKPTMTLELDLERRLPITEPPLAVRFISGAAPDRAPLQRQLATTSARIGMRWSGLGNGEWRAGVSHEPSPQPVQDADPFLALGDRHAASIGFGTRVRRVQADLALRAERRATLRVRNGVDGFVGRYRDRRIRVVLTLSW